jgi:[protein-PII] uridylyltransferase
MQEPNIKNGCGGLRDYQNLHWMVFAKYRVKSMDEMVNQGLINYAEKRALNVAYDFLLRTRTTSLSRSRVKQLYCPNGYNQLLP